MHKSSIIIWYYVVFILSKEALELRMNIINVTNISIN